MSDVVLAALIGAAASIIVNLITAAGQRKKRAVADAVKEERLENRLRSIERKLDTHNGYADKIGGVREDLNKIAIDIAVIKTELQSLKEN